MTDQTTLKVLQAFKEDENIMSVERKNGSVVVTYQLKEDTPTDLGFKHSLRIVGIDGEKLRGTIISDLDDNKEKQDTENYKTPDELLIELIQKQGLHVTYLQIKELINRQPK
ncbi:hypothetical protein CW674_05915 [Macrococcoides caseolyticum]|uniref:hypothetical protein n=1 Tax=Macrococcoides caseolyticum TaxID=69966 RepID=UPI000C33D904|nr:hypothetical protein [Macrococcus caseolyticus]PKE65664.1 hypothetical protein CW674_05915 [Macrococcus caseolyticus]